ncbi:hypothetical protein Misp06_02718 [Microbulbifer sp. NBRC 101763]|uniref:hypothetical protein n=1 Tax=unclassified Microbulbifer TaxID=2619833 RepID=UPI00309D1460
MKNTEIIEKANFQLCSVPDSEGLVLEISKGEEPAFLEVRVDENGVQWFRFFSNENHVAITLEDMEKAIEIAKREVVNTSIDM